MPRNVIFAAPFPSDVTMRFVRAAARHPDVKLLGIVHTPPSGTDARPSSLCLDHSMEPKKNC